MAFGFPFLRRKTSSGLFDRSIALRKPKMTEPINFLMIVTDQHRADYLGCAGHPVLRTPNIDGIAKGGTRFDRFYVATPICMPNRATLMTGRMSTLHGVRHNGIPLPMRANTFVDVLRANGYDTALIGKSHLQTIEDVPPRRGGNPAGDGPLSNAWQPEPEFYGYEEPGFWNTPGPHELPKPYYGFDHVDLVTQHGDRTGGAHADWLKAQGVDPATLRGPANQLPHTYTCPQAIRTRMPEELYSTSYIRMRTVEWLKERAGTSAPFFLSVNFPDPHHPFTPPGRFWDMYKPEDMALPRSFDGHRNPPPQLRWLRDRYESGEGAITPQTAFMISGQHALEAMALTCGMIAMIDDAVGEILATLDAMGLARNTVVCFTADHGEFLGDHNLLLKGPIHFQSLVRIPFIWKDPARSSVPTTSALGGTLDIARTVLARAELTPYAGMQGIDLDGTLRSGDNGRKAILIEEDHAKPYLGMENPPPRLRTIVTPRYRLSLYLDQDWGEIYDLIDDPAECNNLWESPAHGAVRDSLLQTLAQEMTRHADRSPWPRSVA